MMQTIKETGRTVIVALAVVLGASYVMAWTGPSQSPPAGNVVLSFIPKGAVMAFDLATCPTGWTAYTAASGRNIIGAGTATGITGATAHVKGQTGGEEKHLQTASELAAHQHSFSYTSISGSNSKDADAGKTDTNYQGNAVAYSGVTSEAGSSVAANVMDPYIVLTYCVKS